MDEILFKADRKSGKCEHCGKREFSHEYSADGREFACNPDDVKRHAANVKRRVKSREYRAARADAMDSIGMKRVRGNLGGTYYE